MTAIVAIVGRPNVGKSTLFNRFVGRRAAIVDDQPGVTRDRNYADAHLHGRDLTLVDTGGFDPESEDPMRQGIVRHVLAAIEEADAVLCVLDGSSDPVAADREAVTLLRRSGKPVVFAANKVDNEARTLDAAEHYSLGVAEIFPISALHGRGLGRLEQALVALLPPPAARDGGVAEADTLAPRLALIGRPNAGKSSLFNLLVGTERSLVDDRPGTTRDPIDCHIERGGHRYLVVDTAGIRRRSRVERGVESASVMRALRAIDRAEVAILMCDATEGVMEQDARLLGLCADRRRAVVVGLNKMDLIPSAERRRVREQAATALHFAGWTQLVEVSAKTGAGVSKLLRAAREAAEEFHRRVPTAELNRFFAEVLERQPPPTSGHRAPRIYFVTQAETAPPVFVAVSSAPSHIQDSYQRFVQNQIRKAFGFRSVPVTVRFRQRRGRDVST
ncbi:MAG: ribosome biogenesis GTPase Der [Polyangiaceae bacterium]|nr:ribosome biogenesis GTPase Der [Polyangiaceae bacterium]